MYLYNKTVPCQYTESMNLGTRYESYSAASAFWLLKRFGGLGRTPYVLYIMPDVQAGWKALAELPFMERAEDTGTLITDRLAQYGSYEYELDGKRICEAFLSADDIGRGEFALTQEVFAAYGGKLKDCLLPEGNILQDGKIIPHSGSVSPVTPKAKENVGGAVYETYTAPNRASAIAFLRSRTVNRRSYYIIVETPEGRFGRDIGGMFSG